jgi:hypothetical protein
VTRAFIAGTSYFLALFALGFLLGTVRVLFVAPHLGTLAATLLEVPVMLTAAYFLCRWVLRRWRVPRNPGCRWMMVAWFLVLLFVFETVLGILLFGRSLSEQAAVLATPAGLLGLSAQVVAALLLVVAGNGKRA